MEKEKARILELIVILVIFALVSLGGSLSGMKAAGQVQENISGFYQQEAQHGGK